jgi:hypothetical protein
MIHFILGDTAFRQSINVKKLNDFSEDRLSYFRLSYFRSSFLIFKEYVQAFKYSNVNLDSLLSAISQEVSFDFNYKDFLAFF